MYKIASDKRQASLYRGRASDWINGEERLSGPDYLKQLQFTAKTLQERIKQNEPGSEKRRQLGREVQEVNMKIKAIRDALPKAPPDWKMHFVNEAKRLLSDSQFEMVLNAAKIEAAREAAKQELLTSKARL